ncbi:hypothetical protein FACS1894111_02380 [Clostridia bacterium]|nr:hypothetical protein FACS1894111_02380 [Clostridia bacterium]
MPEQVKDVFAKVVEWWNKFQTRQKALMVGSFSVVFLALIVMILIMSKPTMVSLYQAENTKQAAEVKAILEGGGVHFTVSNDGLNFSVEAKNQAVAEMLLGENSISAEGYDWDSLSRVFDGGFSATEADKSKKYKYYLEKKLEKNLTSFENVDTAQVTLDLPEDSGTVLAQKQEKGAMIALSLTKDMEAEQAEGIAKAVATAIGAKDTSKIVIIDSKSQLLYGGGEAEGAGGSGSGNLSLRDKAGKLVAEDVRRVLQGTLQYEQVAVAPNLDMDFTDTSSQDTEYYIPEGLDQPLVDQQSEYESQATGGLAGVPGTDSNGADGTTYVTPDTGVTQSSVTDSSTKYLHSNKVTNSTSTKGNWNPANSTLSVSLVKYKVYNEKTMKENGELAGTTFSAIKTQNQDTVKQDVDPDVVNLVSTATGIPTANITVVAYEQPVFQADNSISANFMNYLPIILAALIMLMLGFVVFRSTRREQEPELATELSVEELLESTKEAEQDSLENIGFTEKSEARIMIEKFVEENPQAAASLLRNWLNEEWE